jgi:hypothetical protein
VRLVIDLPADTQQLLEAPDVDQPLAGVPRPGQERLVDLEDRPVRETRQVAAGGVVVEILGVVLTERGVKSVGGYALLLPGPPVRRTP